MIHIDKKFLPSKNFLNALLIAVSVILIAVIINYSKTNSTKYINPDLILNASSTLINIDIDEDGLPDWKENLYGTSPLKSDTDGDGTNDLDEINQNRDPLKANTAKTGDEPTDKIDQAIIEENERILQEYKSLNDIDKFSRSLFSNIIASQPINGAMDQETMDSIVAKAVSEIPDKNHTGVTKIEDLTLLKTSSADLAKNLSTYATNFFTEMDKLKYFMFTDIKAMSEYIVDGNIKAKDDLLKIADKYQGVVNNLIKMPVPVAIGYYDINYHLAVINQLEKIIAVDRDVANSGPDSLGFFSNISIYNSTIEELISTLSIIESILNTRK